MKHCKPQSGPQLRVHFFSNHFRGYASPCAFDASWLCPLRVLVQSDLCHLNVLFDLWAITCVNNFAECDIAVLMNATGFSQMEEQWSVGGKMIYWL